MNNPFTPLDMLLKAQNEASAAQSLVDEIATNVESLQRYVTDTLDSVNAAVLRFQHLQATEPTTEELLVKAHNEARIGYGLARDVCNDSDKLSDHARATTGSVKDAHDTHTRKEQPVPEVEPLEQDIPRVGRCGPVYGHIAGVNSMPSTGVCGSPYDAQRTEDLKATERSQWRRIETAGCGGAIGYIPGYVETAGCGGAIGYIPGSDYSPANFVRPREPNDPLEPLDVDPATSAALTAVWEQYQNDVQRILMDAGQRSGG